MKQWTLLTAIALLLLTPPLYAQAPFAVLNTAASMFSPAIAEDSVSFATSADFAAAGYGAEVFAESHGGSFDPPQNIAKSSASFYQPLVGDAVARSYGYTGAYYHVGAPIGSSTNTEISSQWILEVTTLTDEPFTLMGFMPIHGVLSALARSSEAEAAIAYAFTGIRMVELNTGFSVTQQGEIWVSSDGASEDQFTQKTNGIFSGFTTVRENYQDPEGLFLSPIKAVELSNLLVYDLSGGPFIPAGTTFQYEMTFFQKVSTGLSRVDGNMAFTDFRSTTRFGVMAVDPNTGQEIPDAIQVRIFSGSSSAAAPEPASLALGIVAGLPLMCLLTRRRR